MKNLLEWMIADMPDHKVEDAYVQVSPSSPDCKMRYLHAGSGAPVVLLHGLLGAAEVWHKSISILSRSNSVFAIDQLLCTNHGWVNQQSAEILDASDRLKIFLDAHGLDEVHLVGHSYGGSIAAVFAGRYPGRVASLALIAPATSCSDSLKPIIRFWKSPLGRWFANRILSLPRSVQEHALTRMYGDVRTSGEDMLDVYLEALRRPGTISHILDVVQNWDKNMNVVDTALMYLKQIPVLLIWGDRDRTAGMQTITEVARRLPNAESRVMPGAGHLVFDELPQETNLVLMDWLRRVSTADSLDADSQVA